MGWQGIQKHLQRRQQPSEEGDRVWENVCQLYTWLSAVKIKIRPSKTKHWKNKCHPIYKLVNEPNRHSSNKWNGQWMPQKHFNVFFKFYIKKIQRLNCDAISPCQEDRRQTNKNKRLSSVACVFNPSRGRGRWTHTCLRLVKLVTSRWTKAM